MKELMRKAWEERNMDIDKDCLCNNCSSVKDCEFAWDLYNFGDNCLMDK